MKVSIITVSYNSQATIRDTIESVLSQSYEDIEYIVIDGASKDSTVDIIKEYEPAFEGRMKWLSEKDSGIYDAMNKGISQASGEIVGIINSDDIYAQSNIIKEIVSVFKSQNVDSVFGNIYMVKQNQTDTIVRNWRSSHFKKGSFKKGWHPPHPSFFVKKSTYEKYGTFDTSFKISSDFELMLRLLEKHQVSTFFYNSYIVKMRLGGASTRSIGNVIEGNKDIIVAFKKNNISVSPILYPFYRFIPKLKQFFNK